jgi:hypothetical protein
MRRLLILAIGSAQAAIAACGGDSGTHQISDAGPRVDAVPEAAYAIDLIVRGSTVRPAVLHYAGETYAIGVGGEPVVTVRRTFEDFGASRAFVGTIEVTMEGSSIGSEEVSFADCDFVEESGVRPGEPPTARGLVGDRG